MAYSSTGNKSGGESKDGKFSALATQMAATVWATRIQHWQQKWQVNRLQKSCLATKMAAKVYAPKLSPGNKNGGESVRSKSLALTTKMAAKAYAATV